MKRIEITVKEHDQERIPLSFIWNNKTYEVDHAYFCSLQHSLTGVKAFKCMCRIKGKWHTLWMDDVTWFVEIEE